MRQAGPVAARGLRSLPFGDRAESFLLRRIWSGGSADMLDTYLVSGYQNPRINLQSILVRHFLVRKLFGDEFAELMEAEIRHAVELNETLRNRASELGVKMGAYLDPVKQAQVRRVEEPIAESQLEFERRWHETLAARSAPEKLALLEFACGSANDYRAFVDYGLGEHLDYRGVDLTAKNIENARHRYPDVAWEVADILHLPHADGSVDYVVASDIFEHLSPDGMTRALAEATRLARRGLALTFFNMSEAAEHEIRQKGIYHWNTLSRPRVEAMLARDFGEVTVIPVAKWLREGYAYPYSYNKRAYTIFAERPSR